jgi:diguanylate cyclase (GGDEF)-like protein/PAS domain S-box-containing protein
MLDAQDDFRALFEGAPDLMYMHDLAGTLSRVNRAFERVTGYSRGEVVGQSLFDLLSATDRKIAQQRIFAHLGGGAPVPFPMVLVKKTGEAVQLEVSIDLVFSDGNPIAVQGYARDVTTVVTFTRYLQLLHRLSSTNYEHIDELFAAYLATGCEIFGVDHAMITTADGRVVKAVGDVREDRLAAEIVRSRDTVVLTGSDSNEDLYLGSPIIIDEAVYGVLSFWSGDDPSPRHPHPQAREVIEMMARSIAAATHQRQLTDQLAHQATHDALTGLPNRFYLQRELDRCLRKAAATGRLVAVVFIDLDRFKQINDTLGHEVGDAVLEQLGRRLQQSMMPGDTLARMGGDEFTAVLTHCQTVDEADAYARTLMSAVRAPCRMGSRELFVTASVGVTLFPRDGDDAATLLRNADSAMYAAKYGSRNDLQFYKGDAPTDGRRRLELETHLRRALERDEFQMQFQPQFDLMKRLASLEALLIWENPELGRIGPSEFIPIAEDTGMILAIGSWVLQRVCCQVGEWQRMNLHPVPVAVNVSALQFAQPDFVATVADALRNANAQPSAIELELTESLIMRDVETSANLMRELRAIGVKIAIDDFGTGYSSLSYLRRLPADSLKIDKSFLQESELGPATLALVRAVVALAHATGLTVTAEGVESSEQLAIIREAGCDRVQGHLFGAALPKLEVEHLLRERLL